MALPPTHSSFPRLWTGRGLGWLLAALLIVDAVTKLFKPAPVLETMIRLGYLESTIDGIGIALLVSTLLYLIPRTSILGALLLTAYMGGAVATNLRAQQALFPIVFPVICASIAWLGLWLQDARLQQFLPLKRNPANEE